MKVWYYSIHYNAKNDYFFGMVEDNVGQKSNIVFTIDDTNHMVNLIKNKDMSHIDDTIGLMYYLRRKNIIGKSDLILFNKEPLIW